MDRSAARVTLEDLAPGDLRGAALRKSYARSPNQALFWRPRRTMLLALLTAGTAPTGVLLLRLWKYATHHRYRAAELVRWLGGSESSLQSRGRWTDGLQPTGALLLAGTAWAAGGACVAVTAGVGIAALMRGGGGLTHDPRDSLIALSAIALLAGSSLVQIVAILTLRLRVDQFVRRLEQAAVRLRPVRSAPELPGWVVWPMVLIVPWSAVWLAGYRWVAVWMMPAIFAVLASEVQRGYITVTDRRLRYALARRIGFLLHGGSPGGR